MQAKEVIIFAKISDMDSRTIHMKLSIKLTSV